MSRTRHYIITPRPMGAVRASVTGRRLFGDKELMRFNSYNTYDYTARQYPAATATFDTPDPLCEQFYWMSPYSFCGGNPIARIDPSGMIHYKAAVEHTQVSSAFNPKRNHPIHGVIKFHNGVDLSTNGEGHDVHALADGVVSAVRWNPGGYGRYVVIQHNNGYQSLYAHLQKDGVSVNVGDKVRENDIIAKSGNTGGSTGPHLHLTIAKGNALKSEDAIDPESIDDLQDLVSMGSNSHPHELPEVIVVANIPIQDYKPLQINPPRPTDSSIKKPSEIIDENEKK